MLFWILIAILSIVFSTKELFYNLPSSILSGWMLGRYSQKLRALN